MVSSCVKATFVTSYEIQGFTNRPVDQKTCSFTYVAHLE